METEDLQQATPVVACGDHDCVEGCGCQRVRK